MSGVDVSAVIRYAVAVMYRNFTITVVESEGVNGYGNWVAGRPVIGSSSNSKGLVRMINPETKFDKKPSRDTYVVFRRTNGFCRRTAITIDQ